VKATLRTKTPLIEDVSSADLPALAALWTESFPNIPLSADDVRRQFEDFGLSSDECLVARAPSGVAGFAIATNKRIPFIGCAPLPGCLAAVVVSPEYRRQRIGTRLVREAERRLQERRVEKIRAGYPTYLRGTVLSLIGVDIQWLRAVRFFEGLGYAPCRVLDSMSLSLENWQMPPEVARKMEADGRAGVTFSTLDGDEEKALMAFLKQEFPGSWHDQFCALLRLEALRPEEVLIVKSQGRIVGFAGPFHVAQNGDTCAVGLGLAAELRGQGLGLSLIYGIIDLVKKLGARQITLFGAVDKINYYGKAGFMPASVWLAMEKVMGSKAQ
jgi:GNAT superfamily N-acetyltransferase